MGALGISLTSLAVVLFLIALRLPIGVALGSVSLFGFAMLTNWHVSLKVISEAPYLFASSWDLTAIPMFLLLGAIANNSGISTSLMINSTDMSVCNLFMAFLIESTRDTSKPFLVSIPCNSNDDLGSFSTINIFMARLSRCHRN